MDPDGGDGAVDDEVRGFRDLRCEESNLLHIVGDFPARISGHSLSTAKLFALSRSFSFTLSTFGKWSNKEKVKTQEEVPPAEGGSTARGRCVTRAAGLFSFSLFN